MNKKINIQSLIEENPIKVIITISLIIRLLIAFFYRHVSIYPDSEDYIYLAERLWNFDLTGYEGQRSPGYPLLLCIVNRIDLFIIVAQSFIGIVTLVYIYKMSSLFFKWKISFIFTLAIAYYIPTIFFEYAVLSETLTYFFIIIVFYLFCLIITTIKQKKKHYLYLGLSCSYLVLIKPFYIFLPILLFFFLSYKNKTSLTIYKKYILILLFPIVIFLSWSYVNKINTGYFVSTTFYGFNIAQNCVSFAENTSGKYTEIGEIYAKYRNQNIEMGKNTAMSIWEALPELEEQTGLSFPDLSKLLYDYSITTILLNPQAYLKQVAISWIDFWKTSLYYDYNCFAIPYSNIVVKYITLSERIILQLIKILFVLLIPYNIICFFRKKMLTPQFTISVIVFTASILQAIVTYGTNSRFSFPFEALIAFSVILNIYNWKIAIKEKN